MNFEIEQERLISIYKISDAHAGCYICNYESDFLCHKHNGGCRGFNTCKDIFEKDKEKTHENE